MFRNGDRVLWIGALGDHWVVGPRRDGRMVIEDSKGRLFTPSVDEILPARVGAEEADG